MRTTLRVLASLTSAVVTPAAVWAADLATSVPAYGPSYEIPAQSQRRFYVRGDVGIAQFALGKLSQAELGENGGEFVSRSIGDAVTIGTGFGWQINDRVRLDVTGEYRSTAQIKALDNLTGELSAPNPDGTLQSNTLYQGQLSSYVGLLNGYWDMFRFRGFTPYVGAGIGLAVNKVSGMTTMSTATFTDALTGDVTTQIHAGYAKSHSQTNLAWALMAGTSYDLSTNAKLDIGYRYLNLGSGTTASSGFIDCTCGTVGSPLKMADIDAHELRIGIRWSPTYDAPRLVEPMPPLK